MEAHAVALASLRVLHGQASRDQLMAVLRELEIPKCGCPYRWRMCMCRDCRRERARNVLAGKLPARGVHEDYLEPCPHVLAMEEHTLDYGVWGDLLHRYHGDEYHELPRPASATAARPGSAARIAIMAARYDRGESLWHRGDLDQLETLGQVGHRTSNGAEKEYQEVVTLAEVVASQQAKEEAKRANPDRRRRPAVGE